MLKGKPFNKCWTKSLKKTVNVQHLYQICTEKFYPYIPIIVDKTCVLKYAAVP